MATVLARHCPPAHCKNYLQPYPTLNIAMYEACIMRTTTSGQSVDVSTTPLAAIEKLWKHLIAIRLIR